MQQILKDIIPKPDISFEDLFEKEVTMYSFDINCKNLPIPDYTYYKIDYVIELCKIVEKLKTIHQPCLYWFEASTIEEANEINQLLNNYRSSEKDILRTVPVKNSYHKKSLSLKVNSFMLAKDIMV